MPTNWSEICVAVLHSLFIFTSMRLRGNSWFLLRGPMRAIVPVQMDLGGSVISLATEELFGHGQEDDFSVMFLAILQTSDENCWINGLV